MQAIPVGRLDHKVIGALDRCRRTHDAIMGTPNIPGEQHGLARCRDFGRSGTQNMTRRAQPRSHAGSNFDCFVKGQLAELSKCCACISDRIKGQGLLMTRGVVFIGVICLFLLEFRAVDQQEFAEFDR